MKRRIRKLFRSPMPEIQPPVELTPIEFFESLSPDEQARLAPWFRDIVAKGQVGLHEWRAEMKAAAA